ncbi:MAG: hypothetical protein P4L42_17665 [Desulfocapsaceae bacterium]|nr:hypothetical protein [Desulfocapsaceae bacterium]
MRELFQITSILWKIIKTRAREKFHLKGRPLKREAGLILSETTPADPGDLTGPQAFTGRADKTGIGETTIFIRQRQRSSAGPYSSPSADFFSKGR